jgi:hypothetical protein
LECFELLFPDDVDGGRRCFYDLIRTAYFEQF